MTPAERVTELLALYGSASANAAELLCDWHPADDVAFTVVEGDLSSRDLTYGQLRDESARFAAALAELGVEPGDAVAALMGKSAELVVALLGIWRRGGVHVPLFTAFAPAAIALRLQASGAKVVLVDTDQRAKLQPGPDLPDDRPWQVVVVGGEPQRDELSFQDMIAAHRTDERGDASVAVGGDGVLVLLFTSGTTGTPKGVPVPVKALASFVVYLELGLDVTPDDVFWNAADPGWAYGLYYAILAPMAAGRRSLLLHAGFTASLTYQVMERYGVTNFAAAPTARLVGRGPRRRLRRRARRGAARARGDQGGRQPADVVHRLRRRTGEDGRALHRRQHLVPDRRRGPHRRGRLVLLLVPGRRHHHHGRLPDRPLRR